MGDSMKKSMMTTAAALAVALAATGASAQRDPAAPGSGVIGSHQIDRYEAIRELQQALKANPRATGDWVILGELAHEVALDVPAAQDNAYYRISRDAYEKAQALEPTNPGLKAAVQFARDQEAGARRFDEARKAAARTYLESRRRAMARSGINPTVRVFAAAPQPEPPSRELPAAERPAAAAPAGTTAATAPAAPAGASTYAVNRPYYTPQGQPFTYQQYQQSYLPGAPARTGAASTEAGVGGGPSRGGAIPKGAEVKPPAAAAPPR